jgi:hypothetical protein
MDTYLTQQLNWHSASYEDSFFPLLRWDNIIAPELYAELKREWPCFDEFETSSFGQANRQNLVLNENFRGTGILHPSWSQLRDYFESECFLSRLLGLIPEETMRQWGLMGKLESLSVDFSICQSQTGYENPWHVDTRKRLFNILIYFGDADLQSGGEIGIAKVKTRSDFNYPQFPNKEDIENTKYYRPRDNFGLILLSCPNSYHKGMPMIGMRRFLYIGINSNEEGSLWYGDWSRKAQSFDSGLYQERRATTC